MMKYFGEEEKEEFTKIQKGNSYKTIKYIIILILTGIALFFIGDILGEILQSLCDKFMVSEFILGILLGIITSMPELITFFEAQKHYAKKKEKLDLQNALNNKDIEKSKIDISYENDDILGVIEASNNLVTSNIVNLFIIQTIGIILVYRI